MCGIVGYIGDREATEILVEGLRRLEYRGYDSAGIALVHQGSFDIRRAEGKLKSLEDKIKKKIPHGSLGIGHTRWATHGRPSETNAHPHRAGNIVLVHNGIIENHVKLRAMLSKKGHTFKSETDTEIVCHLIQQHMYEGMTMFAAFRKTLSEIEGSYALVVMNLKEPNSLYVTRKGSPLVIGLGKGENFVASDIPAVLPQTRKVVFLEDGDVGVLSRQSVQLWDIEGHEVKRLVKEITWNQSMAEKGGYKHFMLKEIFEQPRALIDSLNGKISKNRDHVNLEGAEKLFAGKKFPFEHIYIVACGTSYHAGLVGKYWIEEMSRLPVSVEQASEFRYRNPIINSKTLIIPISQSGETADTLAAITDAKKKGAKLLSICNVIDSSIPRISHHTLYTHAGPEIGVASTKAFITQLAVLLLFALFLGDKRQQLSSEQMKEAIQSLVKLPEQMEKMLKTIDPLIQKLAPQYSQARSCLYFGRGVNFPIALEGALKLKEISYIHAEGYAAGEMKHGPIALIDRGMPVIVLVPQDRTYEKVFSNIEEVRARGARVLAIAQQNDKLVLEKCEDSVFVPKSPWYINPIMMTLPLQLLAYYIADHKGTDVDQPRNLAKSVTVE